MTTASKIRPLLVGLGVALAPRRYAGQHPTEAAHEFADAALAVLVELGLVINDPEVAMPDRNVEDVPIPPDDAGPLGHTALDEGPLAPLLRDGEPLFTLEQAKVELAKQECGMYGHDFEVVQVVGGGPSHVLCSRCGTGWKIGEPSRPEKVLLVRVVNIEGATHPALLDAQAIAEADLVISYDDAGRCKVVKSRVPVEAVIT